MKHPISLADFRRGALGPPGFPSAPLSPVPRRPEDFLRCWTRRVGGPVAAGKAQAEETAPITRAKNDFFILFSLLCDGTSDAGLTGNP